MLEQLVMYLWRDMPITGWSAIFAGIAALVGAGFYLQGKRVIRENSSDPQTLWLTAEGDVIQSQSYSVAPTFESGRRLARLGLTLTFLALIAYAGFMGTW